jgi:hypothetical protein
MPGWNDRCPPLPPAMNRGVVLGESLAGKSSTGNSPREPAQGYRPRDRTRGNATSGPLSFVANRTAISPWFQGSFVCTDVRVEFRAIVKLEYRLIVVVFRTPTSRPRIDVIRKLGRVFRVFRERTVKQWCTCLRAPLEVRMHTQHTKFLVAAEPVNGILHADRNFYLWMVFGRLLTMDSYSICQPIGGLIDRIFAPSDIHSSLVPSRVAGYVIWRGLAAEIAAHPADCRTREMPGSRLGNTPAPVPSPATRGPHLFLQTGCG